MKLLNKCLIEQSINYNFLGGIIMRSKLTLDDYIKTLRNSDCPHQRRIACSTCEYKEECNALESLLDIVEDLVLECKSIINRASDIDALICEAR